MPKTLVGKIILGTVIIATVYISATIYLDYEEYQTNEEQTNEEKVQWFIDEYQKQQRLRSPNYDRLFRQCKAVQAIEKEINTKKRQIVGNYDSQSRQREIVEHEALKEQRGILIDKYNQDVQNELAKGNEIDKSLSKKLNHGFRANCEWET